MADHLRIPKYRHHKARNLAVVTIDGKDQYLGSFNSPESWQRYYRLVADSLSKKSAPATQPPPGQPFSIQRLCLAYAEFAETYYVKEGKPTAEVTCITYALRRLIKLYGSQVAADFGPKALKLVRDEYVRDGQARSTVNNNVARVKRMFRWAVENELVPVSVYQALATVAGLRKGRCNAREPRSVRPVEDRDVDATLPFLSLAVQAMVQLQRLTGCRPGEICLLRPCDVERKGEVWCYQPSSHKTEHHEQERRIFLGPQAQEILRPWLDIDPQAFCFSPARSVALQRQQRHARRRIPLKLGNRAGTNCKAHPKRPPRDRYSSNSYRRAIARACQAVKVPIWSPNRLRHTRATQLRKLYGLDAAQVVLGHREAFVTELYAERDFAKAAEIMKLVG